MVTNTQVSNTTSGSLLRGVLTLDSRAYEAIRYEPSFLPLSASILVAASIANGIANMTGHSLGFVGGFVQMLVAFMLFGLAVWLFGIMFSSQPDDISVQRVLQVTGSALLPMLLFAFTPIPLVGWILNLIGSLWVFLTTVRGIKVATGAGTGKALVIIVLAGTLAGLGILLFVVPVFR